MDAQHYISSGLIEWYVSGMITQDETEELETAIQQFPEVAAAVDAYRYSMERYVLAQSITPRPHIRDNLFLYINNHNKPTENSLLLETVTRQEPKTRPMENKKQSWKWVSTVAFLLLVGSLILNYVFFNRYREFKGYKDKYQSLLVSQNSILSKSRFYESRLLQMEESLDFLQEPGVKRVQMPGTKAFPEAMATVFWNPQKTDVYLRVNNLPEPAADKQYQLWAIVDGKPIDMGVFEMGDSVKLLQKMKTIGRVDMFAVTLEKKGGAVSPTLEQMYVAGKPG